jgi:hypothetical protein
MQRAVKYNVLAIEVDRPAVRVLCASDALDEGGLSGSVVTDEAEDLTGIDFDVHATERSDSAVALPNALRTQHSHLAL